MHRDYCACSVAYTLVLTYTNDSSEEVEAVTTLLEYTTELEAIGVTVLVGTELMTFFTTLLDPSVGVTVLVVVVMATLVIMVTLDFISIVFFIARVGALFAMVTSVVKGLGIAVV